MKTELSRQSDHEVFKVGSRDTALLLLTYTENVPDVISAEVKEERYSFEQLDERANKLTRLLEEILSRPQLPPTLEIKRTEFRDKEPG